MSDTLVIYTHPAEYYVQQIRDGLESAREGAYALWCGKWRELRDADGNPYPSFRAAINDRFARDESYIYRLKDRRMIELELESATGSATTLPESHARELKKVSSDDRPAVLEAARQLADSEGVDVAARHINQSAQTVALRRAVIESEGIPKRLFLDGKMSVDVAYGCIQELNALPQAQQLAVQQLIAQADGLSEPMLIPHLAQMIQRETSADPSRVYAEIKGAGTLYDVPLKAASLGDLERAKAEARRQRIEERAAEKRRTALANDEVPVEEVLCTLYKGDPQRTVTTLQRMLGEDYHAVARLIAQEMELATVPI